MTWLMTMNPAQSQPMRNTHRNVRLGKDALACSEPRTAVCEHGSTYWQSCINVRHIYDKASCPRWGGGPAPLPRMKLTMKGDRNARKKERNPLSWMTEQGDSNSGHMMHKAGPTTMQIKDGMTAETNTATVAVGTTGGPRATGTKTNMVGRNPQSWDSISSL